MTFALRLTEDRLGAGARLALPPTPRVLYASNGAPRIESRPPTGRADLAAPAPTNAPAVESRPPTGRADLAAPAPTNAPAVESRPPTGRADLAAPAPTNAPATTKIAAGTAWHGTADVVLVADAPSVVLRFELVDAGAAQGADVGTRESRRLLEHAIDLDPARAWLMRCDRVDFAPGGVALPHGHKGGGIRCLLAGALEVSVGDHPPRLMHPGDAWFESGREPVLAKASPDTATAFVRVSILPREIRGQSSIVYVDPADAGRGRPRQYTVYVDEPLMLL